MAWVQADLDAIEEAIVSGVLTVKYSDKEVTYRSLNELIKVRELIRESLGLTNSASQRILSEFDRGL